MRKAFVIVSILWAIAGVCAGGVGIRAAIIGYAKAQYDEGMQAGKDEMGAYLGPDGCDPRHHL